jgi:hypothetical protein
MTAAERAWIAGIAGLQKKIDRPFAARTMTMTRAKMTQLARATGGCSRKLNSLGTPSARHARWLLRVTPAASSATR